MPAIRSPSKSRSPFTYASTMSSSRSDSSADMPRSFCTRTSITGSPCPVLAKAPSGVRIASGTGDCASFAASRLVIAALPQIGDAKRLQRHVAVRVPVELYDLAVADLRDVHDAGLDERVAPAAAPARRHEDHHTPVAEVHELLRIDVEGLPRLVRVAVPGPQPLVAAILARHQATPEERPHVYVVGERLGEAVHVARLPGGVRGARQL